MSYRQGTVFSLARTLKDFFFFFGNSTKKGKKAKKNCRSDTTLVLTPSELPPSFCMQIISSIPKTKTEEDC